ncbi:hypothetical protein [Streptomyces sp. MBT62]|nr:hypothetical protein [Streptomyces sp. MBT62]MBK3563564.1 hypothetical protein [Streptomyces sp. MBT62]
MLGGVRAAVQGEQGAVLGPDGGGADLDVAVGGAGFRVEALPSTASRSPA